MLELKNLYFTVEQSEGGGTRNIIDGMNFTFEDGKFYAITGPNGSGKTTLAKLIMGINPATQGEIIFNGTNISGLSIAQRAKAREQALWWTAFANLSFNFNDAPDAEIRIAFDPDDGAWSYVGTDNRNIPLNQPTMNESERDIVRTLEPIGFCVLIELKNSTHPF